MPAMLDRLADRFGWRGLWLMLLGTFWMIFGVGVFLEPVAPRPWVLYEHLPAVVQASGWWLSGLVAVRQGYCGPDRDDSIGHVALYLMPAVRLLSFAVAWLVYLGSLVAVHLGWACDVVGYENGWFAASIWCLVSVMLALAAAWPNPLPPMVAPPPAKGN